MLQQHTNKTITISPLANNYEADEVSPEVEVGVVAGVSETLAGTQICYCNTLTEHLAVIVH